VRLGTPIFRHPRWLISRGNLKFWSPGWPFYHEIGNPGLLIYMGKWGPLHKNGHPLQNFCSMHILKTLWECSLHYILVHVYAGTIYWLHCICKFWTPSIINYFADKNIMTLVAKIQYFKSAQCHKLQWCLFTVGTKPVIIRGLYDFRTGIVKPDTTLATLVSCNGLTYYDL